MTTGTLVRDPYLELADALDALVAATEALRDAGVEKRDALVACDPDRILAATRGEEEADEAARRAELERALAMARAAEALGLSPTPSVSLGQLLPSMGEPVRTRMATARARLRALVDEVTETNDLNRQLTRQSLEHVASLFGILSGERTTTTTYGPGAAARAYKLRGGALLDRVA